LRLLPGLPFLRSPFPLRLLLLELLAMVFQCLQVVLLLGLSSFVFGCGSTGLSTCEASMAISEDTKRCNCSGHRADRSGNIGVVTFVTVEARC